MQGASTNPKLEIPNPKQIQNSNVPNPGTKMLLTVCPLFEFWSFEFV
jgi:hypothetical protein